MRRVIPHEMEASVRSLTLGRHLRAVFVGALAVAGCSSAGDTSERPGPSVDAAPEGGGAAVAAGRPVEGAGGPRFPATPLCALAGPPAATSDDVLVWSDEFDGARVDASRWNVLDGAERLSTVVSTFARDHVSVANGSLFVTTTKGATDPSFAYTTGRVDTANHFARTYGRMDVRARFPIAPGVWYAVWARPWATSYPEIDIEVLAKTVPEVWFVNHWTGGDLPPDQRRKALKVAGVDPTVFHVYSVVWRPGILEWYVDGEKLMDSDRGVPTTPIHWTINAWVGGWGGTPTDATPFPTSFEVDYIRMYRVGGLVGEPAIRLTEFTRPGGAPYNVPPYHARTDAIELEVANFDEACFHVEMREGGRLLAILDRPPFRFPLDVMPTGRHELTFVATDGVRQATATAVTTTY